MPKIMENIDRVHQEMSADDETAKRIGRESVAAIMGGMGKEAWATYMKNFGTGDQLIRLLGEDTTFNQLQDAKTILSYVVVAGPCTVSTDNLGIALGMPVDFAMKLDDGVTGD